MRFYVAGGSHELQRVRHFFRMAGIRGHELVHDWTVSVRASLVAGTTDADLQHEVAQGIARANMEAILQAQALVMLAPAEGGCDCWAELGGALVASGLGLWGGCVVTVGEGARRSVVARMAPVHVDTDEEALEALDELDRRAAAFFAEAATWKCRGCGCTQTSPCEGGCRWVAPNLCDRCVHSQGGSLIITGAS